MPRIGGRILPPFFIMNRNDTIRLSPRLAAVAELVPTGHSVIDVGTDHAMIPVWLAQTGRAAHIWASDVRTGPLESAARLIEQTRVGDRVSLRLTDGLQGFCRENGDVVILAGMGGETMISILSETAWLREDVLLVLQPQTKQYLLRRWLWESGFAAERETLVRDAGRIYTILTARAGRSDPYSEAELHTGLLSLIGGDALLPVYLEQLKKRAADAAPYDPAAAELLREYENMEERLAKYAVS